MDRDRVIQLLVEFFRDSFAEDPGGVGDYFAQGEDDFEEFYEAVEREWPQS